MEKATFELEPVTLEDFELDYVTGGVSIGGINNTSNYLNNTNNTNSLINSGLNDAGNDAGNDDLLGDSLLIRPTCGI